jgi:hypothetical protein
VRLYRCSQFRVVSLSLSILISATAICSAQISSQPTILAEIATAFSGTRTVTNVELTGTAHWHAGSLQDSGPATLTASSDGTASMQLDLTTKGSWTESQAAISMGMTCQWTGNDAVAHQGDFMNCNRAAVWFLPLISLQPAIIPTGTDVLDQGNAVMDSATYRQLQIATAFAATPSSLAVQAAQASITDIGFNPTSLLPQVLKYEVHPDNGAAVLVPIEIRYSNYQKTNGVEIPYTIQRFVNGSLQLEIDVTSVQIS